MKINPDMSKYYYEITIPEDNSAEWSWNSGKTHPFFGQTHTKESRELMSQSAKERTDRDQPAYRKKLSDATKKAWEEGKLVGHLHSTETKAKLKETSKNAWIKRIENDWHKNGPGK